MTDTAFECDECGRSAVGLVKLDGSVRYLCRSHYRDATKEYGFELDTRRLLPGGVDA